MSGWESGGEGEQPSSDVVESFTGEAGAGGLGLGKQN